MADAFLQFLLQRLNSLIQKELGLIWGVDKEMKKLSSLLTTIQAVLEDADEKQIKNRALQNWLRKLKDAAYKVDDILDECSIEVARLESNDQKVHTPLLCYLRPQNILFCRKIGSRMRDIRERLDEIAEERFKFHLIEGGVEGRLDVLENRQTGSIITESKVYGRDEDKEKIIQRLVEVVADSDDISVYPIVGLGGLGKTTLAQMVFNDERVMRHFELRIWVCISEDFGVKRIIKAIIESATGSASEALDLDPLQRRLQHILNGKRYLLVLDDVWNEDQEKWDRLKHVLACASRGASIIVTTRSKRVASIMGTISLHQLSGLTEDECWLLFKERAFGHDTEGHPNLVALGKEIMKKCGGVPLAVKSLGSMMRYKSEENQWQSVVDSDLWSLPQDEYSILPALRLSYSNLPSKLRQCFAYCAIFPKDFVIEKELLIQLWMANDFIPFTEKLDPEDIGNEICNELCWRSFLEDIEKGDDFYYGRRFKMHDLVHDLAQSVMEDECFSKEIESSTNISKRTCHFTSVNSQWNSYPFPKALYQVETLRTFLVRSTGLSSRVQFSCDFSKLSSFRVFGARMVWLTKLSSSISRLKHLRYLDLSLTKIQMLPESICTLYNLQTLDLTRCYCLWELPKHMNRLKNLRHLYLGGCYNLSQMPPKIGEITCLKTITWFIVGKKRGCHLAELKDLNLGGYLCIRHLQRVENPLNAKANLIGKRNLRQLGLSWEDDDSDLQSPKDAEKVLEALEPHANLEIFDISGYKGVQFPFWMRDHILNNVVDLSLSDCHNCSHLPPLSLLASLRTLSLSRISRVMYIDDNFQGVGIMRGFPSLQKLTIEDLPSLQMMCIDDNFQGAGIMRGFPSLQNLTIKDLPSFQMMCIDDNFQGAGIMRRFPSLQNLTIEDLPSLQRFSREDGRELLPCLTSLRISKCPKLTLLPRLPSVTKLFVSDCNEVPLGSISNLISLTLLSVSNNNKLTDLPQCMLLNLTSLNKLYISSFSKLKSFPEQGMEGLKSLKNLQLINCRKFTTLSEGLQHLSCLEKLTLTGCPELVALPDGIKYLSSLQHLQISSDQIEIQRSRAEPCGFEVFYYGRKETIGSPKLAVLPEALRYVPALQSLYISCYPNLASLPHWLGNLTSLQTLLINDCPKLSSLPASIQGLTKLQKLVFWKCPELVKRCEKETGEDWYKIAHIPNVYVN